ncbi:MAG TPA: radical SAM protein [Thermoanaerobaculaceae bacterium]|nr:radical SAM protein [Thermoanaerobaculaceae bacterium]HRS16429.1 radical SAM protein [Thermoanaerobaculaceae bacterium]
MNSSLVFDVVVDDDGRLALPSDLARRFNLVPGSRICIEAGPRGWLMHRPPTDLAKVYVEPTSRCNLTCATCMRNSWDEPSGDMSPEVWARLLAGLGAFSRPPDIFFGGIGEPLAHPEILQMVRAAKALNGRVELITNGIGLTEPVASEFVAAKLDRLWVSLDSATADGYLDVRLGDALPTILANLRRLQALRSSTLLQKPALGVAFVAMRRNVAELPRVIDLAAELGADRVHVSNLLAYSPEMLQEVLYCATSPATVPIVQQRGIQVTLPSFPVTDLTRPVLASLATDSRLELWLGDGSSTVHADWCPFVEAGSTSVRWDGAVSPCPPLLHRHVHHLTDCVRRSEHFAVGHLLSSDLPTIWLGAEYQALRQRIQRFDFSPCTTCNTCDLATHNLEDCVGNLAPTCGGCLWAQGLIRCP